MAGEDVGSGRPHPAQRAKALVGHGFDRLRHGVAVQAMRMDRVERLVIAERSGQRNAVETPASEVAVQEE